MKRALFCPVCRHEVVVKDDGPVHCGMCYIGSKLRVLMLEDPGAGDVSKETIRPSGLMTPEEWKLGRG